MKSWFDFSVSGHFGAISNARSVPTLISKILKKSCHVDNDFTSLSSKFQKNLTIFHALLITLKLAIFSCYGHFGAISNLRSVSTLLSKILKKSCHVDNDFISLSSKFQKNLTIFHALLITLKLAIFSCYGHFVAISNAHSVSKFAFKNSNKIQSRR